MGEKFLFTEISPSQWLEFTKLIPTRTLSPWIRVSNNIFHSQQWIGRDTISKPQRKYFGIMCNNIELVCSFSLYFLSPSVVRTRSFYCGEKWRRQGHMRKCLEEGLKSVHPKAKKALAFVSRDAIDFHLKCGFTFVENCSALPLEYFDFDTQSYRVVPNDDISIMQRILKS